MRSRASPRWRCACASRSTVSGPPWAASPRPSSLFLVRRGLWRQRDRASRARALMWRRTGRPPSGAYADGGGARDGGACARGAGWATRGPPPGRAASWVAPCSLRIRAGRAGSRAARSSLGATGDDWGLVHGRAVIALTYWFQADHVHDRRANDEVAALAERIGDPFHVARRWVYALGMAPFDGRSPRLGTRLSGSGGSESRRRPPDRGACRPAGGFHRHWAG